jgi:hypothetical protein
MPCGPSTTSLPVLAEAGRLLLAPGLMTLSVSTVT